MPGLRPALSHQRPAPQTLRLVSWSRSMPYMGTPYIPLIYPIRPKSRYFSPFEEGKGPYSGTIKLPLDKPNPSQKFRGQEKGTSSYTL